MYAIRSYYVQTYRYGKKDSDISVIGESSLSGTTITFKPDPQIFTETTEYKYDIIQNRLREMASYNFV